MEQEDETEILLRKIRNSKEYVDYKEIIEEDWPDIAYTVTKEETAYFVKSDEG